MIQEHEDKPSILVTVFWIVMPLSDVVGYHCFGGLCCLHLQAEVKCWYPTTSLRHHNPEDHDLIFITVKNLNLTSLKLYTGRKNTSLSSKEEMGS
jgi:hypothetical protein